MEELAVSRFGRYVLGEVFLSTPLYTVYQSSLPEGERPCLVWVLLPGWRLTAATRAGFLEALKALAQVEAHPNLLPVLAYGQVGRNESGLGAGPGAGLEAGPKAGGEARAAAVRAGWVNPEITRDPDVTVDRELPPPVEVTAQQEAAAQQEVAAQREVAGPTAAQEAGGEETLVFWVTPRVDAVPLAQRLGETRSEREAAHLALQIASGLEHLHRRQVPHGWLNPENIWVAPDGQVFLIHYGLQKLLRQAVENSLPDGLTGFGLGDPAYLAPEQVIRGDITPRVDVYALGLVYYALLYGRPPLDGFTPAETAIRQVSAPLAWPSTRRARVTQASRRFIQRCASKQPRNRYRDAGKVVPVLDRLARGKWVSIRARKDYLIKPPPRNWWPLRIFILALIAGMGIWLGFLYLPALSGGAVPGAVVPVNAPIDRAGPPEDIAAWGATPPAPTEAVLTATSPLPTEAAPPQAEVTLDQWSVDATAVWELVGEFTPQAGAEDGEEEGSEAPQPTPTPLRLPVLLGTQVPGELEVIGRENLLGLEEVFRLGMGRFNMAAWSPDGETLALGTSAGVFLLQAYEVAGFLDSDDEAASVQFFPDGRLAVGLRGGGIQVWDWRTHALLQMLHPHQKRVRKILISADPPYLVSASDDQYFAVYEYGPDAVMEEPKYKVKAHAGPVTDIALKMDGSFLATCTDKVDPLKAEKTLRVWSLTGHEPKKLHDYDLTSPLNAVAISPDGKYLIAGGDLGFVRMFDLVEGNKLGEGTPFSKRVWSLQYISSETILVGLEDGTSREISAAVNNLWDSDIVTDPPDVIPKLLWERFPGDFRFLSQAVIDLDTERKAILRWDGKLSYAGVPTDVLAYASYRRMAFSPDSRLLLAGGYFDETEAWHTAVWNAPDNEITATSEMTIPEGSPFSDDSQTAVLYRVTYPINPRDRLGQPVREDQYYLLDSLTLTKTEDSDLGQGPRGGAVLFGLDDQLLAAGSLSETDDSLATRAWDIATQWMTRQKHTIDSGCAVMYNPVNQEILAVFSRFGVMREVPGNHSLTLYPDLVCQYASNHPDKPGVISHDYKRLAILQEEERLYVYNLETGAERQSAWPRTPAHPVAKMVFSPNNDLLVTGSGDGSLTFWSVDTGEVLRTIEDAHFGAVDSLAFSLDGKRLATGSRDGTVRIWEVLTHD